ncbi:MAG: hypothetical protein HeimC3_33620 [Candidatus Heimdallarchaeota archaeon LC_3]|nr:MAG: hypothetical protein HeimC3_33620 [Candidatus Heimdallarchaeota archaeon LC_3]
MDSNFLINRKKINSLKIAIIKEKKEKNSNRNYFKQVAMMSVSRNYFLEKQ